MKLQEVTAYNLRSATILNESWQDLTESQRLYVGRWEKELWPLLEEYTKLAEATLTADQIQAIFKGAEAQAMAGGNNRTMLGKAGDKAAGAVKMTAELAKKVDAKINELGKMAQNAGPVKNADAKFEQLKKDITAKNSDSKVVQGIQKVSDWAKENPQKASLAVGILTAIAAFAGGPAGGAAAGLILRSTKEMLQGETLSSAVGKSVKTAAYGAIAGWALQGIGDWLEGLRFDAVPYEKAPGLTTLEVGFTETFSAPGVTMKETIGSMIVPEDKVEQFQALVDQMKQATAGGSTSDPAALNAFGKLKDFADSFDTQEFIKDMNLTNEIAQEIAAENDAFLQNLTVVNQGIAALAQGTASGKIDAKDVKVGGKPVQGELDLQGGGPKESMSMEDRFELFLMEKDPRQGELPLDNPNSMGAKLKRGAKGLAGKAVAGAKAAAGKAVAGAKAGAKELGNKVTYKKLMKTWKDMGEPGDTASIMNILQDAGMSNDQIATIGQEANVDLGKPSAKPAADVQNNAQNTAQTGADTQNTAQTGNNTKQTKTATAKPIKKGDTREVNGKTYKWAGALWVDTATNKPVGVIPSMKMGLPNPKLQPIIDAAKKDPKLAKLIKQQVMSKGVEAGSAGAQKAAQAGVKGTEKLDAKGVTR